MSTILGLLLWAFPFVVGGLLLYAGAPIWLGFLVMFVLLAFVVWGFGGTQVGSG